MGRSSNWCTPLLSKLKKLSRWSWTGTGSPENEVGGGATALGQMLPWRRKSSCAAVSGVGISPEVWQSQPEKKGATGSVARWCRCHELDGSERDAMVELIPPGSVFFLGKNLKQWSGKKERTISRLSVDFETLTVGEPYNRFVKPKPEMVMNNKWEIVHVPENPPIPTNQHPTVDVFASVIEPKLTNTLAVKSNSATGKSPPCEAGAEEVPGRSMKNANEAEAMVLLPAFEGKSQLSVVLCLACESENQLERIPDDVLELINAYQLSPFITKCIIFVVKKLGVPGPPVSVGATAGTWELFVEDHFRQGDQSIDGITGFNEEDSQSIFSFMKYAVELTKSGPLSDQVVNAAVIVDPSVRQVISSACDQICSWHTPTNNASLKTNRIEQPEIFTSHQSIANGVATNRTVFLNGSPDECKQLYTGVSCLYPWRWTEQRLYTGSSCSWHPLRHAALVAIEYAAAKDRCLFPGFGHSEDQPIQADNLQSFSVNIPAKRQKTHLSKDGDDMIQEAHKNGFHSEAERPYLCTGFDIYLVWEPCTMCAMALVHQRIKRIFYAFPNPNAGALGSVHRLQGLKSLNHHYAVFRVLLPEDVIGEGAASNQ
ncbi:hypothetical protein HHK36_008913 [Tetracentron sinense]|uniref:CMP/dCMP-type deaminase domain-containing protein n=1 Tax=Tetracentron sinense TaxID=13715 RepID=A0A834ZC53_TETSI|nr:hypothetical protein HHK36_008913 [Tetracentron sinense]